jgi:hypothetical protein
VDHAPGQHDDLANAIGGALVMSVTAGLGQQLRVSDIHGGWR